MIVKMWWKQDNEGFPVESRERFCFVCFVDYQEHYVYHVKCREVLYRSVSINNGYIMPLPSGGRVIGHNM